MSKFRLVFKCCSLMPNFCLIFVVFRLGFDLVVGWNFFIDRRGKKKKKRICFL